MIKKLFSLFSKEKEQRKELFEDATEYLYNHFKNEFGNDIKVDFSIKNAEPKDDLLRGDCKYFSTANGNTVFIHFKK